MFSSFLHCLILPPDSSGASGPRPQDKPPWCFSWCQTLPRFCTSIWKEPSVALLCFSYRLIVRVRHSYASFAFLTPVGAPADMYFTPLASGGGPATCFLFLEVSAEAPRLFFDFPPLGFIPNSYS